VLDIAAAPGGKTSQLANKLLEQTQVGLVVANDIASSRIKTLAHNVNL
jgi:16S rRNA C967 or C1407 C5-methylase (RsmB/RsmF family)